MCKFCERFDFGVARCEVGEHHAGISMAGGSYRFPLHEQFNFCPNCGEPRKGENVQKSKDNSTVS